MTKPKGFEDGHADLSEGHLGAAESLATTQKGRHARRQPEIAIDQVGRPKSLFSPKLFFRWGI
jgi:hypothetical protein